MKNRLEGGVPKKGVAWTVCRFEGGFLARKREAVFLKVVDTPMHTMLVQKPTVTKAI